MRGSVRDGVQTSDGDQVQNRAGEEVQDVHGPEVQRDVHRGAKAGVQGCQGEGVSHRVCPRGGGEIWGRSL